MHREGGEQKIKTQFISFHRMLNDRNYYWYIIYIFGAHGSLCDDES